MHGVSININLPSFGGFTPEELTRKVECFALGLVEPKERNSTVPPCCYTEEEVERLLAERMQSIADGTAELVSHDEVKARIKAMLAGETSIGCGKLRTNLLTLSIMSCNSLVREWL